MPCVDDELSVMLQSFAEAHGCQRAYGTYNGLAADTEVRQSARLQTLPPPVDSRSVRPALAGCTQPPRPACATQLWKLPPAPRQSCAVEDTLHALR